MKTKLLTCILILSNHFIFSQDNKVQILDAESNTPIPFAHIYIEGTEIGVISNEEGFFVWDSVFSTSQSRVIVQHIGYEKLILDHEFSRVDKKEVLLQASNLTLDEIEISDVTGLSLLKKALMVNANQAFSSSRQFESYYREYVKLDSSYTKYADGLIDYTLENQRKKIAVCPVVRQSRSYDLASNDDLSVFSPISVKILMTYNIVTEMGKFLNSENFDKYNYDVNPQFANTDYYEILVSPKGQPTEMLYKGRVIIDRTDSYIKEIEYYADTSLVKYFRERSLLGLTVKSTGNHGYVQYARSADGQNHVKFATLSVHMNVQSSSLGNKDLMFKSDLMVHHVGTADQSQKCYKSKSLYKNKTRYDDEFWNSSHAMPTTKEEGELLLNLTNKTSPE